LESATAVTRFEWPVRKTSAPETTLLITTEEPSG